MKLIKNYGIELYREPPKLFYLNVFPRTINTFIEEINIFKKSEDLNLNEFSLPGGVFLNWRFGPRKFIPRSISYMRYKNILKTAARSKNIAHFWVHPHNFITAPETKKIFEKLCKDIQIMVESGELVVKRQIDFL